MMRKVDRLSVRNSDELRVMTLLHECSGHFKEVTGGDNLARRFFWESFAHRLKLDRIRRLSQGLMDDEQMPGHLHCQIITLDLVLQPSTDTYL
jgi:hypothetical protein